MNALPSKKILILGASSYVGGNFVARLGPEKSLSTFNTRPLAHGVHFDSLTMKLAPVIGDPAQYSHAVVLFGIPGLDPCAQDTRRSAMVNVTSVNSVIDQLNDLGIIPVFTSTELVFDGERGQYVESDPVHPVVAYGIQKLEVERHLERSGKDHIILRLPKIFGSHPSDGTLFTAWLKEIEQGKTVRCARDHVFSPIYAEDMVEGVLRLISLRSSGVFHLANPRCYSRLEMFKILADGYRRREPREIPFAECSLRDFNFLEKRPLNVSLIPAKFLATTGMHIRSLEECCDLILDRWFADKRKGR